MPLAFDNEKYARVQSENIIKRIAKSGDKLYLEFGGKLFDDYHASRVLPGFTPDSKVNMLRRLSDRAEIVIVINCTDIEQNKIRGDLGITYDTEVLRLIDAFRSIDFYVGSVVLAQYAGQGVADVFRRKLEVLGIKTYLHYPIEGYPTNLPLIVSDDGFGRGDYIETSRPLVVVTAPGGGSGKMATCLSQLYHDNKRGISAGYAKFETFPIWNLPLNHPVNIAYEAATADLGDVNMIDPFHLEAYGITTVNYNRDIESFPVLNALLTRITGASPYKSPTDMGVSMAGECIVDDAAVQEASKQEIIRRYYRYVCEYRKGDIERETVNKAERLMNRAGVTVADRPVAAAALRRAEETEMPAAAISLPGGQIITGKTSSLLGASSAALLNALKALAGINKKKHLIPPKLIGPIQKLKVNHLGNSNPRLHTDEVLIALTISAAGDPAAQKALDQLHSLTGCEAHSSVILSQTDESVFRKLGVNLTCEPQFQTKRLYHK